MAKCDKIIGFTKRIKFGREGETDGRNVGLNGLFQ